MCKVYIVRHGRVDFRWQAWCDSKGFDDDCLNYDISPLTDESYDIPGLPAGKIYISTFQRSRDTAEKLFDEPLCTLSDLIGEVPLRSAFDTKIKLPHGLWMVLGRLQWFLNSSRQAEPRKVTRERARRFAEILRREDNDCTVVTHGFFMHTLLTELKREGFKVSGRHAKYKNGELVTAESMV